MLPLIRYVNMKCIKKKNITFALVYWSVYLIQYNIFKFLKLPISTSIFYHQNLIFISIFYSNHDFFFIPWYETFSIWNTSLVSLELTTNSFLEFVYTVGKSVPSSPSVSTLSIPSIVVDEPKPLTGWLHLHLIKTAVMWKDFGETLILQIRQFFCGGWFCFDIILLP